MDLINSQLEIASFVEPILRGVLDFSDYDRASKWWPMGRNGRIVIDPNIVFDNNLSPHLARAINELGAENTVVPLRATGH